MSQHDFPAKPKARRLSVICDIDGTIADCAHRRHHVVGPDKNWPAFFSGLHLDEPIKPVINAFHAVQSSMSAVGILCSGRNEEYRDVTEAWLRKHVVAYEKLYLRADQDYRPDDLVKGELLDRIIADGFDPYLVFDDRNSVVQMWRARGLTCLQVAEGDF